MATSGIEGNHRQDWGALHMLWRANFGARSTPGAPHAALTEPPSVSCAKIVRYTGIPSRGHQRIGDGTLHASAQHLLENFMRFAAAEPPPYRRLELRLPNEKG